MSTPRNYRKNPHTARFLMAFHAGAQGLPADLDENAAERELAARDLLEDVPVKAPAFTPSAPQVALISKLVLEINALDTELGEQAASYTARMDREGAWTRENTTRWIGNLIKRSREIRAAAPVTTAQVADGRYAVEESGTLMFFRVKNGRAPGMVFLDVQASDEWHAIRNVPRIRKIIDLITQDAHAAMIRYGLELSECGDCGRPLTNELSRAIGRGPICREK